VVKPSNIYVKTAKTIEEARKLVEEASSASATITETRCLGNVNDPYKKVFSVWGSA
jgi:hypothetical protein